MKLLTIFVASILFLNICQAQTFFQQGWYIVQNKASYAVIQASSADIDAFGGKLKDVDLNLSEMNAGETVLAFDKSGNKTYCFDPLRRVLVFSGEGSLSKGKNGEIATAGRMLAKIEILSGNDVAQNSFVWMAGQDVAKILYQYKYKEIK